MHRELIQKLNQLVPLNPEQQRELQQLCTYEKFPKDCFLLEAGQVSNHIYFILEGTVIAIHTVGEQQVIPWFAFEGDFINSHSSFLYRKPSLKSLYTLTDCQVLAISYDSLQYLYNKDSIWKQLFSIVIENYYIEVQERLIALLSQSAAERYDALIEQYPTIEAKLKLGHIASFLGITQSTLSRLRASRRRRLRQ